MLYRQASLDAEPEVFLDPNTLSEDGTVALSGISFSEDGRYLAYAASASGSDWSDIHVIRTADKQPTGDIVKWVKLSNAVWTPDERDSITVRSTFRKRASILPRTNIRRYIITRSVSLSLPIV